jgi:putative membrane protein
MFEIEGRMFAGMFGGLPHFILYFLVAAALLTIFVLVYIRLTTHDEIGLIRAGNVAAAVALGGSLIGFVLPLAKAVEQAVSIPDMLIWGLAAFVVQLLAYLVCRFMVPDLSSRVASGQLAAGITVAAVSLGAGLLNAASMSL